MPLFRAQDTQCPFNEQLLHILFCHHWRRHIPFPYYWELIKPRSEDSMNHFHLFFSCGACHWCIWTFPPFTCLQMLWWIELGCCFPLFGARELMGISWKGLLVLDAHMRYQEHLVMWDKLCSQCGTTVVCSWFLCAFANQTSRQHIGEPENSHMNKDYFKLLMQCSTPFCVCNHCLHSLQIFQL